MPYDYETNSMKLTGLIHQGGPFTEDVLQRAQDRLKELIWRIAIHHVIKGDLASAAIHAMALRHLSPEYEAGKFNPHYSPLHAKLNELFGMEPPSYSYQACDSLLKMVKDELAGHGVTDSTVPSPGSELDSISRSLSFSSTEPSRTHIMIKIGSELRNGRYGVGRRPDELYSWHP